MQLLKRIATAGIAVAVTVSGSIAQESGDANTFGRWTLACAQNAEGAELCEVRQMVSNEQGQEIVRLAFGRSGETGRELAIRTPQGVLLPAPVELAPLDAEATISAPYRTCLNQICIARALVQDDALEGLIEASQPAVRFRDRSGRQIRIIVSLEGLTDGLAALDAR